jgi:hypothetical protein
MLFYYLVPIHLDELGRSARSAKCATSQQCAKSHVDKRLLKHSGIQDESCRLVRVIFSFWSKSVDPSFKLDLPQRHPIAAHSYTAKNRRRPQTLVD